MTNEVRSFAPGIGQAVAERTITRKITEKVTPYQRVIEIPRRDDMALDNEVAAHAKNLGLVIDGYDVLYGDDLIVKCALNVVGHTRTETWADVAERVAKGSASLEPRGESFAKHEYERMAHHLRQASLLMSGRHLQHGDETQATKNMELYTNCATAAASFLTFYLLLNGSGVGRAYDDNMIVADFNYLPIVVPVIDMMHKDVQSGEIQALDRRTAEHLYAGREIHVFEVPDSREGWAKALEKMELMTYQRTFRDHVLLLDFSKVRPRGTPIMGMQGRPASGPGALMNAIRNVAQLRDAGMAPWRAAMYADHYLAECVLVGGARRAARMATKHWKDATVLDFIQVKRGGFLWSSNNSVTVDAEFWRYVEMSDEEIRAGDEYDIVFGTHAKRVFDALCDAAYHDGTGEPGIINVDKLTWNDEGVESLADGNYAESERYKMEPETLELTKALYNAWRSCDYLVITNPCGEIVLGSLGGYCVSGNTRILFKNGQGAIRDLVGVPVEVWNGEEWSVVTPFKTGENQQLLRVTLSDGSYLDCTPYHRFSVKWSRQGVHYKEVQAKDLKVGHILPTFRVGEIDGNHVPDAYTYGVFLGDGWIKQREHCNRQNRYGITLYKGKHDLPVVGERSELKTNGGIEVNVANALRRDWMDQLKGENLPEFLFYMDKESTLNFVRGWLDTDGCYHKDTGGVSITTCEEGRARDLQLLLRRAGFSYVTLKKVAKAGDMTNFGPRNKSLWMVYIPAPEARLVQGYRVKSEYPLDLDRVVKQPRVVSVEPLPGLHETYCFTEPKRGMGVFGNMLTYQCVIADVVPFHANNQTPELWDADAEEAFRVAARALIRTNTMNSLYNKEVRRTNRIGVGITGLHEYAWARFGLGFRDMIDEEKAKDFWLTLSRFKRAVQEEARDYAAALGMAVPHTNTTVKPAGTTSKLFGLTEGAHLPSMREYLRWVQFRNDDPLVDEYQAKGYPVRKLQAYSGTTIVGFPTRPMICTLEMGDKLVTAAEATPEEQYQYLRLLEKYWIVGVEEDGVTPLEERGNQVSYTLKFDPKTVDFEQFKKTLREGQSTIRCCSVMPQVDTSAYEYQPEEPVEKSHYELICAAIKDAESVKEDIGLEHVDCGGACPISFNENQSATE